MNCIFEQFAVAMIFALTGQSAHPLRAARQFGTRKNLDLFD
jgi:hypothetical protein